MDASFAFFLVICTLFGVAGGLQGKSKGSSFLLWFAIAAFLPLFGFLASLVYPGHRHELRRRCDGCGRLLPITDTMCMGCGTDLAFPEVRYMSVAGSMVAVGPDGREIGPPSEPDDELGADETPSPYERVAVGAADAADPVADAEDGRYERAENPYERAAGDDAPDAPAATAGTAGQGG